MLYGETSAEEGAAGPTQLAPPSPTDYPTHLSVT